MAIEYYKVLNDLDVSFKVIGRGNKSAKSFYNKTGVKPILGGLDSFLADYPEKCSHAIVAVGVERLAETTKQLLKYGIQNILVEKPAGLNKEEREEDRKIKRKIKEELRDINYRANLNTNMQNDTMENANVISENIGDNIEKSIAKLISNGALSVDDSDKIEGFTIEGMFCDSPNEEQPIKFVKYTMGVSLIIFILYVGSKVFLNKD